jgi:hypothetical protein
MQPFAFQQRELLLDLLPIIESVHTLTPVLVTWRVALREKAYGSAGAATVPTVSRVSLSQVWRDWILLRNGNVHEGKSVIAAVNLDQGWRTLLRARVQIFNKFRKKNACSLESSIIITIIFILFKTNSCTLFNTRLYSHLKH